MTASAKHISRSRVQSPPDAGTAAPAVNSLPNPPAAGAAVFFSDPVSAFLAVAAAHDRVTVEEFLTRCISKRMMEIGLPTALDLLNAREASQLCGGRAEVARRSHKPEVASS